MSNKNKAIDFLKMVAQGKCQQAYDQYIDLDFIHHNQYFKGDRESLMEAMEEAAKANPNKTIEIKHAYEDGDIVITHSHVRQSYNDRGGAVIHVFKFRSDKVIELWDLGQQLIPDSPNQNGPF